MGGPVRIEIAALTALMTTGCSFSWTADIDTACPEVRTWYRDQDDDGWGSATEFQDACGAADEFTARNDRDCDDSDAAITGRIGSICPSQLVLGATVPVGVGLGDLEAVVVVGTTPKVVARAAEDACGASGWGGQLADPADGTAIATLLGATPATWAGYVNDRWNATAETWEWRRGGAGEAVAEAQLCHFDNDGTAGASDYDPALGFLALVKRTSATDWCLGTPDEANAPSCTDDCYTERYGHFACERPRPSSDLFAL